MFTIDEWTQLDIGLSYYIDNEKEHLDECQENLEFEELLENKDFEAIDDYKDSIIRSQNKIDELEELKVKIIQYKVGIRK